uniref:F-box domain-containing protein n=1 Tax=Prymnesium polylepis TaxID=72548 RepID=A0A7S4HQN9_9EUKA
MDWRSLLSAGQQCRAWRRVENDHFVWRALVLRDWPEIAATLAASPQSFKSLAMRLPRLQHLEFKLPEECWWIDWTDDGTDEINWTRRAIFSSAVHDRQHLRFYLRVDLDVATFLEDCGRFDFLDGEHNHTDKKRFTLLVHTFRSDGVNNGSWPCPQLQMPLSSETAHKLCSYCRPGGPAGHEEDVGQRLPVALIEYAQWWRVSIVAERENDGKLFSVLDDSRSYTEWQSLEDTFEQGWDRTACFLSEYFRPSPECEAYTDHGVQHGYVQLSATFLWDHESPRLQDDHDGAAAMSALNSFGSGLCVSLSLYSEGPHGVGPHAGEQGRRPKGNFADLLQLLPGWV